MNSGNLKRICLFLIFFSSLSFADWSVFLLIGQSNMSGQGSIQSEDRASNEQVKVMAFRDCNNLNRKDGQWYTAVPPLHDCNEGVGPGDWLAKTLIEKGYKDTIALVPVAIAGASIDIFVKGSYYNMQSFQYNPPSAVGNYPSRNLYPWVLERLQNALKKGKLQGILLHQGESDNGSNTWVTRVSKIVSDLKNDLNLNEDVPFLAGELPYNGCCKLHNNVIAQIPSKIPNSAVVSANGLTGMKDQYHFDTPSYREMGKRYAEAYLKLRPISSAETPSSSSVFSSSSQNPWGNSSSSSQNPWGNNWSSSSQNPWGNNWSSSSQIPLDDSSLSFQKKGALSPLQINQLQMHIVGRSIWIENNLHHSYKLFDLQGNLLSRGLLNKARNQIQISKPGHYVIEVDKKAYKISMF